MNEKVSIKIISQIHIHETSNSFPFLLMYTNEIYIHLYK